MAMTPNYRMNRNDRQRAKQQKNEQKLLERQERRQQRKLEQSTDAADRNAVAAEVSSETPEN